MTSLVPLDYPLAPADVPRAVDRLAVVVAPLRHTFTKTYSPEWLEKNLRRYLREGGLTIAVKAVDAAERDDDEIADAALRKVGAESQMPLVQKRDLAPGHLQIIAYYQRVHDRDPLKRKQGRYVWSDVWVRNMEICFTVLLACAEFGVEQTRNRESRRANRNASGISLTQKAFARNGVNLEEKTIQNKIWFGIWGELARRFEAEHPVETWFRSVSP
jgi:hypothetical protein